MAKKGFLSRLFGSSEEAPKPSPADLEEQAAAKETSDDGGSDSAPEGVTDAHESEVSASDPLIDAEVDADPDTPLAEAGSEADVIPDIDFEDKVDLSEVDANVALEIEPAAAEEVASMAGEEAEIDAIEVAEVEADTDLASTLMEADDAGAGGLDEDSAPASDELPSGEELSAELETGPQAEAEPEPEPEAEADAPASAALAADKTPAPKLTWFQRLRQGLSRSSGALGEGISAIFTKRKLDDDTLQDLEDILIQADLGVETAMTITDRLADGRYNKEVSDTEVRAILAEEVEKVLAAVAQPLEITKPENGPHVILMIGVNGAGKTTTIGKLAQKFAADGKSVMLAAGDTFRAAAIDQLKVWGQRTGAPVIARDVGADAAGLAYDAMTEARQKGCDILMIDTAGRLQNRTELMSELEKIVRVIKKHDASAPHSVLLVLDATTGQNALNQVEVFTKMAGVTGLVMTKLDGTARGGILVAISAKHKVPVHFIGVGERVEDLEPFASRDFARAIAGIAED